LAPLGKWSTYDIAAQTPQLIVILNATNTIAARDNRSKEQAVSTGPTGGRFNSPLRIRKR